MFSNFFAFVNLLISCSSAIISLANEIVNMNVPNASVKKHVKYHNKNIATGYCIDTANKYPAGFFQLNGNLKSFAKRSYDFELLFPE